MIFSSTVKQLSEASRGPWQGGVEIFKRTDRDHDTQRVRTFHMNFFDGVRKVGKGIYMVEDKRVDPEGSTTKRKDRIREERYEGFSPFEPYTETSILRPLFVTRQIPLSCITWWDHFCVFQFRQVDRVQDFLRREYGHTFIPQSVHDGHWPAGTALYPCKDRDHMMALTRAVMVTGVN